VLPADVSWSETTTGPAPPARRALPALVDPATVDEIARALSSGGPSILVLGGAATSERGLRAASRVANTIGARLLGETFPARLERGAGRPELQRIGYYGQPGLEPGDRRVVLVDAHRPVAFFAYPDQAGDFVPEACEVHVLADGRHDAVAALESLAEAVGAKEDDYSVAPARRPDRPTGALNAVSLADAVGALLPEGAVVVDEANTAGVLLPAATAGAPPHVWLTLTGGAIGQGMPSATGAAIGAPDAKVVNLQADGSAMYTFQSLWTQAREGLDVTTVVLANRSYAILNLELARVGASGADRAARMLELTPPDIDFVSLAAGLGVPASRAMTADELVDRLEEAFATRGPKLIEAVLPPGLG